MCVRRKTEGKKKYVPYGTIANKYSVFFFVSTNANDKSISVLSVVLCSTTILKIIAVGISQWSVRPEIISEPDVGISVGRLTFADGQFRPSSGRATSGRRRNFRRTAVFFFLVKPGFIILYVYRYVLFSYYLRLLAVSRIVLIAGRSTQWSFVLPTTRRPIDLPTAIFIAADKWTIRLRTPTIPDTFQSDAAIFYVPRRNYRQSVSNYFRYAFRVSQFYPLNVQTFCCGTVNVKTLIPPLSVQSYNAIKKSKKTRRNSIIRILMLPIRRKYLIYMYWYYYNCYLSFGTFVPFAPTSGPTVLIIKYE